MFEFSTRNLHDEYERTRDSTRKPDAEHICFLGTEGFDVYNPTAPFVLAGKTHIAARVEPRENHQSRVFIFDRTDDSWVICPEWTPIAMEDPFYLKIKGLPLLGGVETAPSDDGASLRWRTVLYDISSLDAPRRVFQGPWGMKDLRFIEYPDGTTGVFTRPQGGAAGRGTCGYLETKDPFSLTSEQILSAPLVSSPNEDSWEGINQPILLDEDLVGLLGHVAWIEHEEIRHYYAAVSTFFRETKEKTPWSIIAQRDELPPGPAKREDLFDVLFPGGIEILSKSTAVLYLGVSDTQAWRCSIPNPFAAS